MGTSKAIKVHRDKAGMAKFRVIGKAYIAKGNRGSISSRDSSMVISREAIANTGSALLDKYIVLSMDTYTSSSVYTITSEACTSFTASIREGLCCIASRA